jgi:hypothetical protein
LDVPSQNPYEPPQSDLYGTPEFLSPNASRPVPFEDIEAIPGFWRRVGTMFQLLFRSPYELVDRIPVTDGLGAPLRFALLCSMPIALLMAFIGILMGVMGGFMAAQGTAKGPEGWIFAGMGLFYTVLIPISVLVGFFLGGALSHFLLWIWGGLRDGQGLGQTMRANGYYLGFFMVFYLIPILNIFVALGGPAIQGIALARIHRTDTWRGVCAAYTPICCGCLAYAGLIGIIATTGLLK